MADKVTVWFDAEADYLEVQFKCAPGHMKETAHDALMERVDADGTSLGLVSSASAASQKRNLSRLN